MNGMPEVDKYMRDSLKIFIDDPPNTDFQQGYMSALMEIARHALQWPENNQTLVEARKVFNESLR